MLCRLGSYGNFWMFFISQTISEWYGLHDHTVWNRVQISYRIFCHGIIYMYDDESDKAFDEFKIYVVCKGEICEKQDKFLSPLMQKVYQK